ncbi:MAG: hypothetical protein ACRBF0_06735 [Calditrichia bacterium]
MRLFPFFIALLLLLGCGATKQETMNSAEDGKKKIVNEATKRTPAPIAASQTAMLEKYYILDKVDVEIAGIGNDMQAQMTSNLTAMADKLGEQQITLVNSVIEKVITPEALTSTYKKHFSKNYSAEHLAATIVWLESPVGKRLSEMERFVNSPEGEAPLMQYMEVMQTGAPNPERIEKVNSYFQELGLSSVATDFVSVIQESSLKALNAALPAESKMSDADILAATDEVRQLMGAQMAAVLPAVAGFMYKDATDAEIDKMIEFYKGDAGTWFLKTEINASHALARETFGNVYKELSAAQKR